MTIDRVLELHGLKNRELGMRMYYCRFGTDCNSKHGIQQYC